MRNAINIKMIENIKFMTPLEMKLVPHAYLNQVYTLKKTHRKCLKKGFRRFFHQKYLKVIYTDICFFCYATRNKVYPEIKKLDKQ